MDNFTEVSNLSWFDRIKNAIGGVVIGAILFLASFAVIFWNEGRAVQTAQSLNEGAKVCISASCEKVDPANDNKLVHMTGEIITDGEATDPEFNVSQNVLVLRREVEMYQWVEKEHSETRDKAGGGTETVKRYTYEKAWSSTPVNSQSFKQPAGHKNPDSMPIQNEEFLVENATLGAFTVTPEMLKKINNYERLPMTQQNLNEVPGQIRNQLRLADGNFYDGVNPGTPQIGDMRISFSVVKPTTVSILAQQAGDSFTPYQTKAGDPILELTTGSLSAEQMFKQAHEANNMMTWILRVVAFLMMFFGLMMIANPLVVLADVVPFLGGIVGGGAALFAGTASLALWTGTVAIAWIVYRPVIGILLLLVTVGAIVGFFSMRKKKTPTPASDNV